MKKAAVSFSLNGQKKRIIVRQSRTLLEVLREDLNLTGTKHGCETGECGACTVLLDGEPVYACLVLAIRLGGRKVTTIEGVRLKDPVVEAFADAGAVQCGYCTPGMVLVAKAYLRNNCGRRRSKASIKGALSGNHCRCTGYYRIIAAVERASKKIRAKKRAAKV